MSRIAIALMMSLWLASGAAAQEYRVEVIKEGPPKEELAKEMQGQFAEQGIRVIRGASRAVCEVWPCKVWKATKDFTPTAQRLYPFQSGQLMGLIHFKRRGKDFRDQTIGSGWYTLRFGLQPVDGNHQGTSPTRDFFLMVPVEQDKSPDLIGKRLNDASAEAAGSSHPAMLCLQPVNKDAKTTPSVYYDENRDWWILHFLGKIADKKETRDLPLDLVVVGHADE